ncbi:tRNA (adenosine(37)-N6)-threonylcarbamoyltransferase complex transferase subunit TsaD [bacterium]|nr:tRNA (adenosine(37)-N6)-threonylcarbamoyltransferase complex transferase subunit TsaD [bacterium]
MKILAIETSCDDTCIAIIEAQKNKELDFNILSEIVSSQIEIHKKWGGIWPTLAKRAHQKNLIPVLQTVIRKAKGIKKVSLKKIKKTQKQVLKKILIKEPELLNNILEFVEKSKKPKVDAIAITIGPGLEPCLWVGINFARALSFLWNVPLIPVNHIEAHIYVNLLNNKKFRFPAIALIVSGGHTQLIYIKKQKDYKIIGETRDDAAGECLDKIARILGLGYPGGPIIAKKAEKLKKKTIGISLPRPMIYSKDYDFSFSGLKTAVLYDFKKRSSSFQKNKNYIREMCFEAQQAIIDVLIKKTIKAAKDFRVKSIILGGGVSANKELQNQLSKKVREQLQDCALYIPPVRYCTDNAVMTAIAAYFHRKEKKSWQKIKAIANLKLD